MRYLVFLALIIPGVLGTACPYMGCHCTNSLINCGGRYVHMTSLPPRLTSRDFPQVSMNMARNDITAIRDGELIKGLELIESWFTPFTFIGDHAFNESASTMKRIIIQYSNLTALPQTLAELQGQFTFLDMSWAQISDISVLPRMQQGIQWLELTGNQVADHKAVEAGIMPHITTLKHLALGFNRLTQAPNLTSHTLCASVDLDNNNISHVAQGTLGTALVQLLIRNNQLTEIPADCTDQPKLWELLISGNKIKSIDNFLFPKMLTTLHIDNNQIEVLNSLKFNGGTRLRWVQMFNNPLRVIAPDAFKDANQIKQLTLSNTKLTRLPLAVTHLPRIVMLYLNDVDTLSCTCDEAALGAYYLKRGSFNIGGECNGVTIAYFLHEMAGQCPSQST